MNSNKAATVLNRIFHICFFACMAITVVGSLVFGYTKRVTSVNEAGKTVTVDVRYGAFVHMLIYGLAILLLALFCALYYLSNKDIHFLRASGKLSEEMKFRLITFGGIVLILLLQLYFGAELKIYPRTDLLQVVDGATGFAKTANFDAVRNDIATGNNNYMARYPNNFMIMFMLALLYRVTYLILGYIPMYLSVVLNVIAINLSLLFTVLIAKQMWGRRKAVFTLCLLFIFAPFYVYVPFYYTDSLSMPFGILGIYLFILGLKSTKDHRVRKYVLLAMSGALLFIGFKVKGSIGVIFAAAIIYSLLKCKLKEFACVALALILGFGSFALMFKAGYNAVGLVTAEQAEMYEYPMTHWIMMGLKGRGGYNMADSEYTSSFYSKEEKMDANLKVIEKRIKNLVKNHRLTYHFIFKAVWMWSDGTYFIPGHITDYVHRSWLHDFVLRDGENYYMLYGYSNAFQFFLLLMMALSLFKGVIKPKIDFMVLIKGSVFALFLFLLIWEGRSRYLFNMTPLYILMAVDGISYLTELLSKLKAKIKRRKSMPTEPTEATA